MIRFLAPRCASWLAFTLVLSLATKLCQAAEWQWSVPDSAARAYLWIPPDCRQVRGIVVGNHNMLEQGILEHAVMRQTLAELGFAEVWVVPALDGVFDFNKGAGEHFDRVMHALAQQSGYHELPFAPVVPIGHSACATYPWNFAAWNPARTLAVLSVKGDAPQTNRTGYGRANVAWGDRNIDGVPGLMVMGEYEWFEDRLAPAMEFARRHPAAAVSVLCDAGHGHFDATAELVSYLALFIRKAAERRLPAEMPLDRAPQLKAVDPKSGWRMDRWRANAPPTAPAAPYEAYAGDAKEAVWCFDREMAELTEAAYAKARAKKPQLLGIVDKGQLLPQTNTAEQVRVPFTPGDDGMTFKLNAVFLDTVPDGHANVVKWARLPAGTPLGHASGGGPIVISKIVGPVVKTGAESFALHLDRSVYTPNGRNNDLWLLAHHPGDAEYKSAVQQMMIRLPARDRGAQQTITFPQVPDQKAAAREVALTATSDAGVPVQYYVMEGPAEVEGSTLRFIPIPPRSRFPVKVTVVAWQYGLGGNPGLKSAAPIERSFFITE
ncbi:MAG: hypothetical protein H7144_17715 [Burkholderiales bacterium]|nr:hypothetical protein [Phycisphaerae bacterium]